jgi:hypothetical protein
MGIYETREPAGTLDFHPAWIDLHTNVIANVAVGPMDDGVDQSFQPRVSRDNRDSLEATAGT